jgi:hypothetical protein
MALFAATAGCRPLPKLGKAVPDRASAGQDTECFQSFCGQRVYPELHEIMQTTTRTLPARQCFSLRINNLSVFMCATEIGTRHAYW